MSRFDHGDHTVSVHPDQVDANTMAVMAEEAEEAGLNFIHDEQGLCVYGLTENQADTLSAGLRQLGIDPRGGVSY